MASVSTFYFVSAAAVENVRRSGDVLSALDDVDDTELLDFSGDTHTPALGPDDFTALLRQQYAKRIKFQDQLARPALVEHEDRAAWVLTPEGVTRLTHVSNDAIAKFAAEWKAPWQTKAQAVRGKRFVWQNVRLMTIAGALVLALGIAGIATRDPVVLGAGAFVLAILVTIGLLEQRHLNRQNAGDRSLAWAQHDWAPALKALRTRLHECEQAGGRVIYSWWE